MYIVEICIWSLTLNPVSIETVPSLSPRVECVQQGAYDFDHCLKSCVYHMEMMANFLCNLEHICEKAFFFF